MKILTESKVAHNVCSKIMKAHSITFLGSLFSVLIAIAFHFMIGKPSGQIISGCISIMILVCGTMAFSYCFLAAWANQLAKNGK